MQEPDQKYTDKKLLAKGLKRLGVSLLLIVGSTYLFTFAFLNKETIPLYVVLPLAIIAMGVTIYLIYSGIKTIIKATFD